MGESPNSEILRKIIAAIDRGDTLQGLLALEGSPSLREIPVASSYRAYCIAKERGQYREAIRLCQAALKTEPHNPAHFLNLGRIFLLTKQKSKALTTFRQGLSNDTVTANAPAAESTADGQAKQQALILAELRRLGIRKRPVFESLPREHPLNKVAGRVLAKLNLR